MAAEFKRIVEEVGKGKVTIQLLGPEVVPPFEQLQPVSAGAFDMLFTHGAYHGGSRGLALVMDAVAPDPAKRRDSGVLAYLDDFYQKSHGIKVLAVSILGHGGYHCFLKAPLTPEGDWKGRKIRGVSTFHGVIQSLGGSPVAIPVGETYSALEKGVVDGGCMPAAGMVAYKLYEVAKYRVEPTYGSNNTILGINLNKWNALSKDAQAILLEAGKRTETNNLTWGDGVLKEERAELAKRNVQVARLAPAKVQLVEKAWNQSIWELGDKCCGSASKQLRDMAVKAGLAK
jgi:TRAP-type C4-dicarboxylate transport system substrate-binding protein